MENSDQDFWFQPKLMCCKKFMEKVELWIEDTEKCIKVVFVTNVGKIII